MKAIVFETFGEPAEVLRLTEAGVPEPAAGEVRVRMLAAPINPSDLMVVRGKYGRLPRLPATPGFEGVGVVDAAGPGLLGRFLLGKRVAALNSSTGSWAEYAVLPARQAIPLGNALSIEQGATFFVNPATAFIMTRKVLGVPAGEWLLQSAAGSAVGRMIIRLGRRFGFRTLNLVRREEQVAELKSLGADAVLCEEPGALRDQVLRVTDGRGVTCAVDPVGGATASAIVGCLAPGGRMLVYGTLSDEPMSFSPRDLMTPGASIEGFWLANWMARQSLPAKIRLRGALLRLVRDGTLATQIGEGFPLDEIAAAVQAAERPGHSGKVLLRIAAG